MKIIAGLGNPGEKYKNTRHNAGFIITEVLASKHNIKGSFNSKFNAITGKGLIDGEEVVIVQPLTYMNLSGEAVIKVLNWYKIEIPDLLVVYDDISLDLGRIRFRPSGSAGGHNGIESIISSCASQKFARLKVGIGPLRSGSEARSGDAKAAAIQGKLIPSPGEHLLKSFVLEKFSEEETKILEKIIPLSTEAIEDYIYNGITFVQDKYNGLDIRELT